MASACYARLSLGLGYATQNASSIYVSPISRPLELRAGSSAASMPSTKSLTSSKGQRCSLSTYVRCSSDGAGAVMSDTRSETGNVSIARKPRTEDDPVVSSSSGIGRVWRAKDGALVVCNSRGCRPVDKRDNVHVSEVNVMSSQHGLVKVLEEAKSQALERRNAGTVASFCDGVKTEAKKAMKMALDRAPEDVHLLVQYAHFLWHSEDDPMSADAVYRYAVALAPKDDTVLASYTYFLFQHKMPPT